MKYHCTIFTVFVMIKKVCLISYLFMFPGDDLYPTSIDYNDNTVKYIDKTILELREGCKTLHRLESKGETKQFIIQNHKPDHHINMEDKVYPQYKV